MAAKLKLDLSEDALDEISKYYYVHHNHHMIDVRRLMNNALSKSFDKKKLAQWKLKSEAPAAANHPSYISPDMCILALLIIIKW
jgi:post-segregation antitoxin (ccd killing protein)